MINRNNLFMFVAIVYFIVLFFLGSKNIIKIFNWNVLDIIEFIPYGKVGFCVCLVVIGCYFLIDKKPIKKGESDSEKLITNYI